MVVKRYLFVLIACLCGLTAQAQVFDEWFCDRTLRLDYVFAGDVQHQQLYVDQLVQMPRWYGRRTHLAELPLAGNGQITVRSHRTQQVIYRHSFSTLFQEWLATAEAKKTRKSFENVFLVPMPKDTVDVTLDLRNNRREVMASLTHQVVPTDILIRRIGEKDVTPYETIQEAKDSQHCIHVAYLAEGYQKDEMSKFIEDVRVAMEALFEHEPFKSLRDRFHIVAVKAPSQESGTSEPGRGIWKNTALHSHFDTFYSDRYLTTLHLKDMHDWLAGIPYEHIIVLVNSGRYGGGGIFNSYNLTTTHHAKYRPVVVHEFGHSFCGLGDEYAYDIEEIPMYPKDIEPWEPNLTTLVDFPSKWQDLVDKKTPVPTPLTVQYKDKVGVYQGAGYNLKDVYRPCQDCRMRTNEHPVFCPVCQRALTHLIDFYTK